MKKLEWVICTKFKRHRVCDFCGRQTKGSYACINCEEPLHENLWIHPAENLVSGTIKDRKTWKNLLKQSK